MKQKSLWSASLFSLKFLIFAILFFAAFGMRAGGDDVITLVGTGSSLPEPLYRRWADEFNHQSTKTQVRYLVVGTGESMKRILGGTGDFGGGDAPIPDSDLKADAGNILQVPGIVLCVVPIYNLPDVHGVVSFTGQDLADIFLGKIKTWDDPALVKINPGITLPHMPIQVFHRPPGRGSNYIFTEYLSKLSPEFEKRIGRTLAPKWPVGANAGRSEDMVAAVKNTVGAIGFTERQWAVQADVTLGAVRNAAGENVRATEETMSAATTAIENKLQTDLRVSLTNAPGKNSYPITSFTWLYVPTKMQDTKRANALRDYLDWVYSNGQTIARSMGYTPLPPNLVAKIKRLLPYSH